MTQRNTRRANHHSCAKGRRIRIKLTDGRVIRTRFIKKSDRYCITEDGRFPWKTVVVFNILKKGKYATESGSRNE